MHVYSYEFVCVCLRACSAHAYVHTIGVYVQYVYSVFACVLYVQHSGLCAH